jgi:hypothetical protein
MMVPQGNFRRHQVHDNNGGHVVSENAYRIKSQEKSANNPQEVKPRQANDKGHRNQAICRADHGNEEYRGH